MTLSQDPANGVPTFGKRYAVLNLDFMSVLIDFVKDTAAGKDFISNCSRWIDAVHKKDPQPLTVFTTLYFSAGSPQLSKDAPFTKLLEGFGSFEAGVPTVELWPEFSVEKKDVVLQKTRWYAGAGSSLEQILRAQNIDTVIIVWNPSLSSPPRRILTSKVRPKSLRCCHEHNLPSLRSRL